MRGAASLYCVVYTNHSAQHAAFKIGWHCGGRGTVRIFAFAITVYTLRHAEHDTSTPASNGSRVKGGKHAARALSGSMDGYCSPGVQHAKGVKRKKKNKVV